MKKLRAFILTSAAAAALGACASQREPSAASAYADYLIGRFADSRSDYGVAADRYFRAIEQGTVSAETIDGALDSALAQGDERRARHAASIAMTRHVASPMGQLVRAADALASGRERQARSEMTSIGGDGLQELAGRMIEIWAKAPDARAAEAVVSEFDLITAPPPFSGIFDYQRALMLDYAGKRDEAAEAFARARASEIWLPPAAVREVDLLGRMGRAAEARALYAGPAGRIRDPALERATIAVEAGQPGAPAPLTPARGAAIGVYALGALLIEERETDRGLAMLTLANMLDPSLDAARFLFAEGHRQLGHPELALAALAALPPDSPYTESAKISTAWILRSDGRNDEAVAAARAAAEGGGRLARTALADFYRGSERWAEADGAYTALIDSIEAPVQSDWILFFSRGAVRERLDRWPEAEADLKRALELSPNQSEALNYLGYSWIDRGEHLQEGLALVQRAAALRPTSGHIIDSLGWAYYRLGDYAQAIQYLERAVELEPADATLNDHLGDALWRAGRRVEARYQWSRALSLNPSDAERRTIDAKLANGMPPAQLPASASASR
ncbi:MAG: tetratricopeptide repeat protein [Hyphomonadaceae bacterium]|nr:tetratricopeptide repeat protein [Hyphomonadaceae bacterium]